MSGRVRSPSTTGSRSAMSPVSAKGTPHAGSSARLHVKGDASDTRSARSTGTGKDKLSSARQLRTEATIAFDRLTIAQQDMPSLLKTLAKCAENSADAAQFLRQRLIDNEVQWLGVMQRMVGEQAVWSHDLIKFLSAIVMGGSPVLHKAIIGGKLSSLLVQRQAPKDQVAQIVIHCLSNQDNIETFLGRQEGLANLASSVSSEDNSIQDTFSTVMLVANILGRHPPSVTDLMSAKLDTIVSAIGINNIPHVNTEGGMLVMKAVLYCLRFFVRVRCDDTRFIETCLSLSAHSIPVLPDEATDLCGDMCAVVRDFKFARKNRNIFLNLVAIVPKVNPSRALHIMRFMTNYLQFCAKDVRPQFCAYATACAMLLTKDGEFEQGEAIQLLDLLCVSIENSSVEIVEKCLDYRTLRHARDLVIAPGEELNAIGKIKFFAILHCLVKDGTPPLGVSRIVVSLNDSVGVHISEEEYAKLAGTTGIRHSVTKNLDRKVESHLKKCITSAAAVETQEETVRAKIEQDQSTTFTSILERESTSRRNIETTDRELQFRVFDRNAILFHKQEVMNLHSACEEWQHLMSEDIQAARSAYVKDSEALAIKMSSELENKLRNNSLSDRERSEARTRFKFKAEDAKRKLRLAKENTVADKKWKERQGVLMLSKLHKFAIKEDTELNRTPLFTLEYCEEIARGEGLSGICGFCAEIGDDFTPIAQEEAIAWRGIERQATKVFAPQKYWLQQRREQLYALESAEARSRLETHAMFQTKYLEIEYIEGLELLELANRSKRVLPVHHLALNVSLSSFGASYGARPQDSGNSLGLRRIPSRRRSLSVLTSEARNLQICEEQEEIYRQEIQAEGIQYLVATIELCHCQVQEANSRTFMASLVHSHYERVLQTQEGVERLGIEKEKEVFLQILGTQLDEREDRKMIETEYDAVTSFFAEVDVSDGHTDLVEVLIQMIDPPDQYNFSCSHMFASVGVASNSMMMSF